MPFARSLLGVLSAGVTAACWAGALTLGAAGIGWVFASRFRQAIADGLAGEQAAAGASAASTIE